MTLIPRILRFDSVDSTNSQAERLALEGAEEGLCIVADEQTAGRGRLRREWSSPKGAGLYFTMLLRPRIPQASWPLITLLASIAVTDVLREQCRLESDIKWPNDVLVTGRKICGILAETSDTPTGRAIALGIGINLTAEAFPPTLLKTAISLEEATGQPVKRDTILSPLVPALIRYYQLLNDGQDGQIIAEWCKRSSYANDKFVQIVTSDETIRGVTHGLERNGALRLRTADGKIKIVYAGDVTTLREDSRTPSNS